MSVKPYGAFVDIGGASGLLHISQISHDRITNVDKVLSEGDRIKVSARRARRARGRGHAGGSLRMRLVCARGVRGWARKGGRGAERGGGGINVSVAAVAGDACAGGGWQSGVLPGSSSTPAATASKRGYNYQPAGSRASVPTRAGRPDVAGAFLLA